jgi:hypothetical protein
MALDWQQANALIKHDLPVELKIGNDKRPSVEPALRHVLCQDFWQNYDLGLQSELRDTQRVSITVNRFLPAHAVWAGACRRWSALLRASDR